MNFHATLAPSPQPRFMMCPPRHFAVTYSINPWMNPKAWASGGDVLAAAAPRQWAGLQRALTAAGAAIETVEPAAGLPDLVFTANAAVVLDRKALLARFRHPERQGEQPIFAKAFRALAARGLLDDVAELPAGVVLEGAGDCLWDRHRGLFWMGCGFRSDPAAGTTVERAFGVGCVALELADPRFYHLDTAFCPLPCGAVIYHPGAFTAAAREVIEWLVAPSQRIVLGNEDATRFAANAVAFGNVVVMSQASAALAETLAARGYVLIQTPLDAFQKSGGSACCLTLRLDHGVQAAGAAVAAHSAVMPAKAGMQ